MKIYINGEQFVLPNSENLLNDTDLGCAMAKASDAARFYGEQVVEIFRGECLMGKFTIKAEKVASDLGFLWNEKDYIALKEMRSENAKKARAYDSLCYDISHSQNDDKFLREQCEKHISYYETRKD